MPHTCTDEEIAEYYLAFLAYNKRWKNLVSELYTHAIDPERVADYISEQIQSDIFSVYHDRHISNLIQYLPAPGTAQASYLSRLLWLTDHEYTNDYQLLSTYAGKQNSFPYNHIFKN